MGITQYRLAQDISVVPGRIDEIAHGKRSITADTALRLSRCLGTSGTLWMNLQTRYDMEAQKDLLVDRLEKEVAVLAGRWARSVLGRPYGWTGRLLAPVGPCESAGHPSHWEWPILRSQLGSLSAITGHD